MIAKPDAKPGPARIALLGCGTVGREVARRLLSSAPRLNARLVSVLVRDPSRDRGLPSSLFTSDFNRALDAQPDLVVELLGGLDPARDHVAEALARGIPVVTANKTLIAHHGESLAAAAARTGAALAYEAAVCAAIPILASLRQLDGDRILAIRGVVNGSCNFILSRLAAGLPFDAALDEARARGLVEPDPSADISGRDSAEKACILAAAAGHPGILPRHVPTEGIDRLTPDDLKAAHKLRCTIKLLAELDLAAPAPSTPTLRVGPTLIPRSHPLAGIDAEENALLITTELAGDLFLRGRGAGPAPTASAILGDIARLLTNHRAAPRHHDAAPSPSPRPSTNAPRPPSRDPVRPHYLRLRGRPPRPDQFFTAVRARGGELHTLELGPDSAWLTAALATSDARACATDLAAATGGEPLVLPQLTP